MWISQSYLGEVELGAKCFIYYLYEDYVEEQKYFTDIIQKELERLGKIYDNKVSLFMPNKHYADDIESEVREYQQIWGEVYGKLPGLLILDKPLINVDRMDDRFYFLSFQKYMALSRRSGIMEKRIHQDIILLKEVVEDKISVNRKKDKNLLKDIMDAIEIKPGIFGIKIDLIRLLRRKWDSD